MQIVIYACLPVKGCNAFFRRLRIVIDGMKVTSMAYSPGSYYHRSCAHNEVVRFYEDESDVPGDLDLDHHVHQLPLRFEST